MAERARSFWLRSLTVAAVAWWLGVAAFVAAQERNGQAAPAKTEALEIVTQDGIEYARVGDQALKLDLARPKAPGKYPGVVCIHGGGWRAGDKSSLAALTQRLAKEGFVAVTVQYRFAPQDRFPAQVDDVRCAVRWLRAHAEELQLDPQRIGAIGFSAGGHLSLMLGLMEDSDRPASDSCHGDQSSKVQAVVNFFGPADLAGNYPEAVRNILKEFLGGSPEEKPSETKAASPITYIDRNDAPILTFHGTEDKIVPYEQAELLDQACRKAGLSHKLETLEGAGHGWGGEQLVETIDKSIAFFREKLAQPAAVGGK